MSRTVGIELLTVHSLSCLTSHNGATSKSAPVSLHDVITFHFWTSIMLQAGPSISSSRVPVIRSDSSQSWIHRRFKFCMVDSINQHLSHSCFVWKGKKRPRHIYRPYLIWRCESTGWASKAIFRRWPYRRYFLSKVNQWPPSRPDGMSAINLANHPSHRTTSHYCKDKIDSIPSSGSIWWPSTHVSWN